MDMTPEIAAAILYGHRQGFADALECMYITADNLEKIGGLEFAVAFREAAGVFFTDYNETIERLTREAGESDAS